MLIERGCQTVLILTQEVLPFTKVFFIDHQLNWWFIYAKAPMNGYLCSEFCTGIFLYIENHVLDAWMLIAKKERDENLL